jgi:hypothetical protein
MLGPMPLEEAATTRRTASYDLDSLVIYFLFPV